jgi:hypothetical protein
MTEYTSTQTNIHPHDVPMEMGLHPMPDLHTTTLKIYFGQTMNGFNIFLPMTTEEVISHLEKCVAELKTQYLGDPE